MNDIPQVQLMQQLSRAYRALMLGFEANIGLSMARWRILLHLYQSGDASQKQLALDLRVDPAALTRQIKAIETQGWIHRHSDAKDNRLTNVALTEQGKGFVEQMLPRRAAFIEKALGDISPTDIQAMGAMLNTLEQRLRHVACDYTDDQQ